MTVCAIIPFIQLKVSQTGIFQEPVAKIESLFITQNPVNPEAVSNDILLTESEIEEWILANPEKFNNSEIDSENTVVSSRVQFSISQFAGIIYITGFLITIFILFVSIFKMIRIIRNGTKISKEKYTIVCTSKKICPFSWGKYIVLSESDYRQNPEVILSHEATHIGNQHSLDLLFAELFILFHWFNPVAWLLKRELQDVHEYEADRGVINQGIDATKYQLMLVKKAVGARSYAIANSLNHSKIKNRITMMLKEKSTQWARLKLLLFAPLAVVLLQAFARPETVRIQESLIKSEGTTISQQSKEWTKDYFDVEIDAFVKKINSSHCERWPRVNLIIDNKSNTIGIIPTEESTFLFVRNDDFPKSDEGLNKMINVLVDHLKDVEKNRCKKNLFSPSIVCLTIDDALDSDKQTILKVLGDLNEEFSKAREEQEKQRIKDWENGVNKKTTMMYSHIPLYVAINERIKHFPFPTYNKNRQAVQQKKESTLRNEDIFKKESFTKSNEVVIYETSDSTKKMTVKGSMTLMIGGKAITLSGDSIDVIIESAQKYNDKKITSFSQSISSNSNSLKKNSKVDNLTFFFDSIRPHTNFDSLLRKTLDDNNFLFDSLRTNYWGFNANLDSIRKKFDNYRINSDELNLFFDSLRTNFDIYNSNFDSLKMQNLNRSSANKNIILGQSNKERQKQAEQRVKEMEKIQKERLKLAELRVKELEKKQKERQKQADMRVKEMEKIQKEKLKQAEQRVKELQEVMEKRV